MPAGDWAADLGTISWHRFDAVEVHPMRFADPYDPENGVEYANDENADFWSVYLHAVPDPRGRSRLDCIGDFPREDSAVLHARRVAVEHRLHYRAYTEITHGVID